MKRYFSGSTKYFTFLLTSLILLVAAGIIEPLIIDGKRNNWNNDVIEKSDEIQSEVAEQFNRKERKLRNFTDRIADTLFSFLNDNKFSQQRLFNSINRLEEYKISVFESDSLLVWNSPPVEQKFISSEYDDKIGQTFFRESDLYTYYTYLIRIDGNGRNLFLLVSSPFEKKYSLDNKYYSQLSWSESLSEKYFTDFDIYYTENAQYSLDGRDYSFDLINTDGYKVGMVVFKKPSLSLAISEIESTVYQVQSALAILAFIFLGLTFRKRIRESAHKYLRFVLFTIYILLLRALLYVFEFPNSIIESELVDPAYFSSLFAFGVVRSPLDFLITVTLFLIISWKFYQTAVLTSTKNDRVLGNSWIKFIPILLLIVAVYLLILRGLGASIRSVIFDSTLRYFKDPDLIPDLPSAVMHLNVLLIGFCAVIVSVSLIFILVKSIPVKKRGKTKGGVLLLFIFFQVFGLLFDVIQKQPQGTPITRIIFITLTFLFAYQILYEKSGRYVLYLYFAFAASFITVFMMNYYNSELERESLKTTAFELIRPNENLLEFMVMEALNEPDLELRMKNAFEVNGNRLESSAFKIWSASVLQKEGVGCEVNFRNPDFEYLGGFSIKFDDLFRATPDRLRSNLTEPVSEKIFHEQSIYRDVKIVRGIRPVNIEDDLLGYLEISVLYDMNLLSAANIPPFLSNKISLVNSTVDFEKLIILEIAEGEIIDKISNVNIGQAELAELINSDLEESGERWSNMSIGGEDYRFYLLNTNYDISKVLAVGLKEKDLSWNLFDFFKIFFVHSLIILSALFIFLVLRIRKLENYKLTFRGQLQIAFLFVSIVPMVLLAVYFRDLTEQKSTEAVFYKLGKRAVNVEEYINSYLHSSVNLNTLFEKAAYDLKIDFSIFDGKNLLYSSDKMYYEIGLMSDLLNPVVYNRFVNNSTFEYVAEENIEKYSFHSFYYNGFIGGDSYIFVVSDMFNTILIPFSDVELDIFLFGSYSLAVILIIIISTILANQISSPIRELTNATKSVASGDLSIEVDENKTGEIRVFVRGFNSMVRQLNKSQAELAELERETAWKEMAKQVAHEIKNPLTPMKLSVQQLVAAKKDNSAKFDSIFEKVTSTIIDQIETLKNIASEFSSFARMPGMKVEDVDLIKICNETIDLFANEKIEFEFNKDFEAAVISADYDQLKRALINLIRNAIQAEASKIILHLSTSDEFFVLSLKDNGTGISPEIIEKVFNANYTTKPKGMGLGLAMVKKYVENVDGSIDIESMESAGTTVTLKFKLARRVGINNNNS